MFKNSNLKNSKWWKLPFKKIVKCDVTAIVSLILIQFGTTITPTLIPGHCIHKGMGMTKVSMFFYTMSQKNDNDVAHYNFNAH